MKSARRHGGELIDLLPTLTGENAEEIHRAFDLAERAKLDPPGKSKEWVAIFVSAITLGRKAGEITTAWQATAPERLAAKAVLDAAEQRRKDETARLDEEVKAVAAAYHKSLSGATLATAATVLQNDLRAAFPPLFGQGDWPGDRSVYKYPPQIQQQGGTRPDLSGRRAWSGLCVTRPQRQPRASGQRREEEEISQAEIRRKNAAAAREREASELRLLPPSTGVDTIKVEHSVSRLHRPVGDNTGGDVLDM